MTVKMVTPEELYQKINAQEKLIVLDVRAEEKYIDFHIEGSEIESLNINKADIFKLEETHQEDLQSLSKDYEIIVTCTTGNSATKCANILSARQYDVVVLEGGNTTWKEYIITK